MLAIEVIYCPAPGQVDSVSLLLAPGACVADALQASGLMQRYGLDAGRVQAGVWSRVKPLDGPLRTGDRVEIYRPLQVDPKEARRLRYKRQRSAGVQKAGPQSGP